MREILLKFARRDVDMSDDVALAQRAQGQFLAHGFAVQLVIDALSGEGGGQLVERDLIALRNILQRAVQLLIRDGEADALGALHLNFLQNQAVEHLLPQHALRRHFDLLLLQPLGHGIHLSVQIAFQHQTLVDDGRNAVQEFAVRADVPGLREGRGRDQE